MQRQFKILFTCSFTCSTCSDIGFLFIDSRTLIVRVFSWSGYSDLFKFTGKQRRHPKSRFLVCNMRTIALDPQTDGISSVRFSPKGDSLLVTSWDGGATIYSLQTGTHKRQPHGGGVLCGAFDDNQERYYSGGLDKLVRSFYLERDGDHSVLGKHDAPVRCCEWVVNSQTLATCSWDMTLRIWDPRASQVEVANMKLPDKAFAMDVCDNTILVATADGSLSTFDVRSVDAGPYLSRPATIGHQIRCARMFENGAAVLIGSIEGRVSVENLDVTSPVAKRYAFKCHRIEDAVFPVNSIAIRPSQSDQDVVFATGGADGTVALWDANLKKRLHQFPSFNTSCASLEFSKDGLSLALAVSYTFESGDIPHAPDTLVVADVNAALSI